REGAIGAPILVLGGIAPQEVAEAVRLDLAVVVWDLTTGRRLAAELSSGARLQIHLKIDTGMNRLGAHPTEPTELAHRLRKPPLEVTGVLSHLACADQPGNPTIDEQRIAFGRCLEVLAALGINEVVRHLANSAGLLADPRNHFDMVRPGIMLYGG